MSESELLQRYSENGCEASFAGWMQRHLPWVHAVALRRSGEPGLAEDVVQAVFVLAARRAGVLARHPQPAGWLHRTTLHLAEKVRRNEARRRRREVEAALMHEIEANPDVEGAPEPGADSERLLPWLDAAMDGLGERDREVLLLRFYRGCAMREVGVAQGTSEAAAKMRVGRALERLRIALSRRGVTCTGGALMAALEASATVPVPAGLGARVMTGVGASGAAAGTSWAALWLSMLMKQAKVKWAVGVGLLVATLGVWEYRQTIDTEGAEEEAPRAAADAPGTGGDGAAPRGFPGARVAGFRPVRWEGDRSTAELDAARRALRTALALPVPKSGMTWPEPAVIEALEAFGHHRAEAFAELRRAFEESRAASDAQGDLIRTRAVRAMGLLGGDVPELKPYLWELARATDVSVALGALVSLDQVGLESDRIPELAKFLEGPSAKSPAMSNFLVTTMKKLIHQDPAAAESHLSGVARLLGSDLEAVRYRAACILLGTSAGGDARVLEAIRDGLRRGDEVQVLAASRALPMAPDAAKPLVPDLVAAAERMKSVPHVQREVWRALGRIQPDLAGEIPAMASTLGEDTERHRLAGVMESRTGTFDDLVKSLNRPELAVESAVALGDLGTVAASAVPEMARSLAGQDEDSRDRILAAIHRIDPAYRVDRVEFDVLISGLVHAESELGQRSPEVERWLLDARKTSTWLTGEEITELARRLKERMPDVCRAFLTGIADKDAARSGRLCEMLGVSR